jgi:hypothetical protein
MHGASSTTEGSRGDDGRMILAGGVSPVVGLLMAFIAARGGPEENSAEWLAKERLRQLFLCRARAYRPWRGAPNVGRHSVIAAVYARKSIDQAGMGL